MLKRAWQLCRLQQLSPAPFRDRQLTSHTISEDELGDREHDGPALDGGAGGAGQEDASNEHEGGRQHGAPLAPNLVCDVSHEQHTHDNTADLQRRASRSVGCIAEMSRMMP